MLLCKPTLYYFFSPVIVHSDRFHVEMFQNHGFKKWISNEKHAIVAMLSDNVTF
jgi:hypothetical protein